MTVIVYFNYVPLYYNKSSDMTKILYIITKSNWGGAQRYVYDMATRAAQEQNCTVKVALGGSGMLAQKLEAADIPVIKIAGLERDVNPVKDLSAFFGLVSLLRTERPDVLHVNSSKIGAMGALAGRIASIPKIIFTAHGWAFNENRGFVSKLLIKIIYWFTIFFSHATITVSENMRSKIKYWPFIAGKTVVIRNGVDVPAYFTKDSARIMLMEHCPAIKTALGDDWKQCVWIGTIAELHPIKSLDTAIAAVAEVVKKGQKVIYAIMGEGQERARLEKQISDLGLSKQVFLTGHVDNAAQYLKAFDIFMLVSVSEGLAYVIIEAGMAGLPVVATAVGGIPELVDDMKSGLLIQPRKPTEIAKSIEFMLEHKSTAHEYARELQAKMKADFSVEKMFAKTFALYKQRH